MTLAFRRTRDRRTRRMLEWLLGEQMKDGGWNCERARGATHSSLHTTLSTLEALGAWQRTSAARGDVEAAAAAGRRFLLEHRLYRSHRTGEVISPSFTRFSFPPRWKFDVLRALDYFRLIDAPWDDRLTDSVALLERRCGRDGRVKLQNRHSGRTWFELETVGKPSRWNTLRALRVQRWVDRARSA
jgi:hypothetical protein